MSLLRSYLEANAILPASDLETAERHKQAQGGSLDTALLELGLLTAAELLGHLSKACGLPPISARLLETGPTRPQGHVPKAMLDIGWVLPLALEDGQVLAAVHPDLPDARLGQLYRQIRGFTPMVAPECCLAKLNAERTGSIVAPRFAMLVLDVLDALQAREPAGTTLVGVPIAAAAPAPAQAVAPPAPQNAPAAPAHAAFTIPYAAAGPQIAVHADGPAGPPPPARPAPQVPPPAAADSISATVVEPVLEDSLVDAAGESLTAAATLSQPTPTHDPAIGGTFPRGDSAPYLAASSGQFPSEARARTSSSAPVQKDSRAASGPKDSRVAAAYLQKDSRDPAATPVQKDSRTAASAPATTPAPAASATAPAHSAPAHSAPAHSAPAHSAPAHSAPAHSAPAPQPERRRPPSGTTAASVPQDSRPADAAPSPAPRNHPRSGGVSTSRSAPLPQLPLAQRLAPARAALAQARERDRITESLVRAAIQVAPRVALFGVKREGLRALAAPGSSLHLPRSLVIPIPDGSLLDRAVSGEIRLRLLTEPQLAFAVGRPLGIPCILEPVYAQNRCVLMLYIDRSGGPFEASEQTAVRDLCDVARGSLEALLRIMGLGTRSDAASTSMRVENASDVIQVAPGPAESPGPADASARVAAPDPYIAPPEPAPTPDVYVAAPEPAPTPDAWLTRSEPPASDAAAQPEPPASEPPAKSESPGRTPEMDGVPELTRRPRRAVIALVNPIRREPTTNLEPSARGWIAGRGYVETPSEAPAADADAPTTSDPQAPTRRLPAADADALVDAILAPVPADSSPDAADAPPDSAATPVSTDRSSGADAIGPTEAATSSPANSSAAPADASVPADSSTAAAASVPTDSSAPTDTAAASVPTDSSTIAAAPVPTDSSAPTDAAAAPTPAASTDTVAASAPTASASAPTDATAAVSTDSPAAPTDTTAATSADRSTATTDTAAASVPTDSAAPARSAAEPVPADSSVAPAATAAAAVQTDAAAAVSPDRSAATTDAAAATSADRSNATTDEAAASVPADGAASSPAAPVSADRSTAPTDAAAPVSTDSSTTTASDAPRPAPRAILPTPVDTIDAAPVPTDSPDADAQTDTDPSASTSGLHMPNLVAPGVKRSAGKRGDRTRPAVEPAVVIPYDLRRPEHRTSPPKTARPRPGVQIPSSLLAPAPLPGSARKGKSPQHPTPPRADDVTLNMPMLVRSPTSLPPEPVSDSPDAGESSLPPELATPELRAPTLLEIPALTDTPAADLAEPPAEPSAPTTPAVPATDLSEAPAPAPAQPPADLSEAPAPAAAPVTPAEPATDEQLDAALAAYLHSPDDPAALAALLDLGAAVYPRIAARFPGPIDPRSASDVRSFPPPSVHGPLLRACVEIGAPIAPHILELLDHQRPQIRFYAAFLFQELRDLRSLRPLAAHAFDPDADVRLIATRVLESYNRHPKFAAATEHVRAALTGRDRDRALLATEAAGTLRDTRAVPILIELLSVRDKQIREAALEALCSITAKHHGYRPAKWKSWYADHSEQPRVLWVMDALKHRDPAVRRWAADELHRVTGHRIPPPPEGEKITPRYVLQSWEAWWTEHGAAYR